MSDRRTISVTINGETFEREVETRLTLADFIRHECLLTGTHVGCEHGVCGACTVLLEGRSVRGCLTLAVQANGKSVETVEGLVVPGLDAGSPCQRRKHVHHREDLPTDALASGKFQANTEFLQFCFDYLHKTYPNANKTYNAYEKRRDAIVKQAGAMPESAYPGSGRVTRAQDRGAAGDG